MTTADALNLRYGFWRAWNKNPTNARNVRRVELGPEGCADLATKTNGVPASMGVELPRLRRIVQGVRGRWPMPVLRRLPRRAPLISAERTR